MLDMHSRPRPACPRLCMSKSNGFNCLTCLSKSNGFNCLTCLSKSHEFNCLPTGIKLTWHPQGDYLAVQVRSAGLVVAAARVAAALGLQRAVHRERHVGGPACSCTSVGSAVAERVFPLLDRWTSGPRPRRAPPPTLSSSPSGEDSWVLLGACTRCASSGLLLT